jgi:hypothetical protein
VLQDEPYKLPADLNRDPRAMPELANDPECRLTLWQVDQVRSDFAIENDHQFIMGQLARVPDRGWLSRMLLLGFGSTWGRSSAIDETDRKALSVRDRPTSVVPRARLADGGVRCASRSAPD